VVRVGELDLWTELKEELEKSGPDNPRVKELQRKVAEQALTGLGVPGAPAVPSIAPVKKPKLGPVDPGSKE